jgi:hypothetical protein
VLALGLSVSCRCTLDPLGSDGGPRQSERISIYSKVEVARRARAERKAVVAPSRVATVVVASAMLLTSCVLEEGEGGTPDSAQSPATTAAATDNVPATTAAATDSIPAEGDVDVSWVAAKEQLSAEAQALVPLQMYYVERYLADVPDKTDVDEAIGAILDRSPEALEVYTRALESYRAMPLTEREARFDPGIVGMTDSYTAILDTEALRNQFMTDVILSNLGLLLAPLPPGGLTAVNASQPGSMEQDPTGASTEGEAKYRVVLTWTDNSATEQGFYVYRWSYLTLAGVAPTRIATLPADTTTFIDELSEPPNPDDMMCYQITAFQSSEESAPTEGVCATYHWLRVDLGIDTGDDDGDGFINEYDDCPTLPDNGATTTRGCPDADGDGWPDDGTDQCVDAWGDPSEGGTAPAAPPGCPQRYAVNWMSMEAINNSAAYLYHLTNITDPYGRYSGLAMNEVDDRPGEEPYLLFAWVNGLTTSGAAATGNSEWCCGENVDVAAGQVVEPDDVTVEGDAALDAEIMDHGMTVFPADAISQTPGLLITVTLMEKDWVALVREEYKSATVGDMIEVAAEAASVIWGCVTTAGIGCLVDLGEAIVDGLISIFGMSSSLVEVDDPDDVMGDGVWVIDSATARLRTADDGAYGFSFEIPTPYAALCIPPVTPCTSDVAIPSRMRVVMKMCLYRDEVPVADLAQLCEPYEPVEPWPMQVAATP